VGLFKSRLLGCAKTPYRLERRRLVLFLIDGYKFTYKFTFLALIKLLQSKFDTGKIKTVALTNFDTERLQIILENEIPVVSNQVYPTALIFLVLFNNSL